MIVGLARLAFASTAFLCATVGLRTPIPQAPPQELDFVPVGVRYAAAAEPGRRAIDHDTIRRARFNVVVTTVTTAAPADAAQETTTLTRIDQPVIGGPPASLVIRSAQLGIVPITAATSAEDVKETAWTMFGHGVRGVIFEDWAGLQQNAGALAEASAFAETITRNMALYAPLRHVERDGARSIGLAGGEDNVDAHWLESAEALLLVAVNHGAQSRRVTFTFPPQVPEAVWQNMLSGGSVNFIAGPTGPFYEHTLPAQDVLVLMIRKKWK
jgi:hypothetical protein